MSVNILNSTLASAWINATTQAAQINALIAAFVGDVRLRYYSSGGVLQETVTHNPWTVSNTNPRYVQPGTIKARSRSGTSASTYCIVAVPDGADILRIDGLTLSGVTAEAHRTNLGAGSSADGLRIYARSTLPLSALPYSLPAIGEVMAIGTNNALSVTPTGEGWNTTAWSYSVFGSFGGGQFVSRYSQHGAYVLCSTGGHISPDNHGALVFDFSTGTFTRLDNANGVPRPSTSPWAYGVSGLNSNLEVTGTVVPAPGHTYNHPVALNIGAKGTILIPCRIGVAIESVPTATAHTFDLDTRIWARYGSGSILQTINFEGDSILDETRNRVWYVSTDAHNDAFVEYINLSTQLRGTSGPFPFPSSQIEGYARTWLHEGSLLRNCGNDGLWYFDPDNASAGWVRLTVSGTLPNTSNVPARYSNGNYYAFSGDSASNTIVRITPPATWRSGTWVVDTVTLAGVSLPARSDQAGGTVQHYTRFFYVPSIDCIAWIPGGNLQVYLLKPQL